MLPAIVLAAATTTTSASPASPHSLAVGAVFCMCAGDNEHYEGGLLRAERRTVFGARVQYDYSIGVAFLGVVAAFESLGRGRFDPNSSVLVAGPTLGLRAGRDVRGSLRISAGGAYAYDPRWKGREQSSNVHVTGYFFELAGELSGRVGERVELFWDVSIFATRSFAYERGPYDSDDRWWYGMAVLPLMSTVGVRYAL